VKLMVIVGTRPQFIKSATLIHRIMKDDEVGLSMVHTGQHYNHEMSETILRDLELPHPTINLNVGSGSHALQTGQMMARLEQTILAEKPDGVIVLGDSNSTLAGALAAVKLHVPLFHIEAGARSYNMHMPEEVNRRLTDHCSSFLFAPTVRCLLNLIREGLHEISCVSGDTMYDALLQFLPKALKENVLDKFDLERNSFAVVTLHRPENVDVFENLRSIVKALLEIEETLIFPVHPRTEKALNAFKLMPLLKKARHIKLVCPVGYLEMIHLVKEANVVLTDSGGLQKESFWLHTPCITLRTTTEWTETVELKANHLVGSDKELITSKVKEILDQDLDWQKMSNPFRREEVSCEIILNCLKEEMS